MQKSSRFYAELSYSIYIRETCIQEVSRFKYTNGPYESIHWLDAILCAMKVGESHTVENIDLSEINCLGRLGKQNESSGKCSVQFTLLCFTSMQAEHLIPGSITDFTEFIQYIGMLKRQASVHMAQKNHRSSISFYLALVTAVNGIIDACRENQKTSLSKCIFNEIESNKLQLLQDRRACYLEIASCFLSLKELDPTIYFCTLTLKEEPCCVRALVCRACAYQQKDELQLAKQDCVDALTIQPESEMAIKLHSELCTQIKHHTEIQQRMYSKMFSA